MRTFKSVLKVIGNVIFTVVIVLLVVVTVIALFSRFGADGRMMIGRYGFGVVVTGSMEPKLPVGSFVLIERKDPAVLKVGDTITFYSDDPTVPAGAPVSHEIIRIETAVNGSRSFYTKGCANPVEDAFPARAENILGKVVWSSKLLGDIIQFAQQPFLYPILISILLVNMGFNIANVAIEANKLRNQEKDAAENEKSTTNESL